MATSIISAKVTKATASLITESGGGGPIKDIKLHQGPLHIESKGWGAEYNSKISRPEDVKQAVGDEIQSDHNNVIDSLLPRNKDTCGGGGEVIEVKDAPGTIDTNLLAGFDGGCHNVPTLEAVLVSSDTLQLDYAAF